MRDEADCESACDLTPNRLPTVTPAGRTINSSIQCVAVRGLGPDLDADRAAFPTPNNNFALLSLRRKFPFLKGAAS